MTGLMTCTGCGALTTLKSSRISSVKNDEMYAQPLDYNDPIISFESSSEEDVYNNILSVVYDAMHDEQMGEKIEEQLFYKYAESIFGTFDSYTAKNPEIISLEEAVNDYMYSWNFTKIQEFVRNHKYYWNYDLDGNHVNELGELVDDSSPNWNVSFVEMESVLSKHYSIKERIKEKIFEKMGQYIYCGLFDEYKFVRGLFDSGYSVDLTAAKKAYEEGELKLKLIDNRFELDQIFENVLHENYYHSEQYHFIDDEIVPSIYKELLLEEYVFTEKRTDINNSRARKINVLKINKDNDFVYNADALISCLIEDIYSDVPNDRLRTNSDEIEERYNELFNNYRILNLGDYGSIVSNDATRDILWRVQQNASDIYKEKEAYNYHYFEHTPYGDIIEDYKTYLDSLASYKNYNRELDARFTDQGRISPEEGLQRAINELYFASIDKGWFIQNNAPQLDNGGVINSELFNLSVSNVKIEVGGDGLEAEENYRKLEEVDRFVKDEYGLEYHLREDFSDKESPYLCSINGANFLKFEGLGLDKYRDIVYDDGSAYYVVLVLEATSDSKLKELSDNCYIHSRGSNFYNYVMGTLTKEVSKLYSFNDNCKEYWLDKMQITFNDQLILDYFKDKYPNIFN